MRREAREAAESVDVIQKEFDEKLALPRRVDKKKAPFYKQRCDIVNAADGGVPKFWLGALQNNMITAEEIQPHDEEPLSYLTDIKASSKLGGGQKGFQLAFVFKPNPYFEETMLTKTYLMDPDDDDECLTKAVGTDITWKDGKNITVKTVEKKQKKKGKVRTLKAGSQPNRSSTSSTPRCRRRTRRWMRRRSTSCTRYSRMTLRSARP